MRPLTSRSPHFNRAAEKSNHHHDKAQARSMIKAGGALQTPKSVRGREKVRRGRSPGDSAQPGSGSRSSQRDDGVTRGTAHCGPGGSRARGEERTQLVQGWAAPRCPTRRGWSLAFLLKVMGRYRILDCPECHQCHRLVVLQRNQGKCCWEAEASLGFWAEPRTSGGGGCSPAPSASVRLEGALTRKG